MIRVYDGPGPDAQLVYEGPDGEPFQIEFRPGQLEPGTPLFIAYAQESERQPLNGAAAATVVPEEIAPETPHEELLQRVAQRLAETSTYVDWPADQVDGSLDEVVRAVLAVVQEAGYVLLPPHTSALGAVPRLLEETVTPTSSPAGPPRPR